MTIPSALPPDFDGLDMMVTHVETLRPDVNIPLEEGGTFHIWHEVTDGDSPIIERSADGTAAVRRQGKIVYLCGWPDRAAMKRLMRRFAEEAGLATLALPDGLRRRQTAEEVFWFNYGSRPERLAEAAADPSLPAELASCDVYRQSK